MREFFSLDGPFNKYGGFLADTLVLSLMWLLFSIPIVTIGAATSAMFYVSTRRIAEREGYITADFWLAFKANFKRATLLWLLLFVAGGIIALNIWLLTTEAINTEAVGIMGLFILPAQFIFGLQLIFMSIYMFPITARFEMGFVQTIKSSFIMANRHFLTTVVCAGLLFAVIIVGMATGFLILAAPGVYAMLSSYLIMRIFKRYRPEMDKDPRLEIAEIEAQKSQKQKEPPQ